MPYQRLAVAVLADWFEVERTLRLVPSRSREALLLRAEARGLRDEYQRLVDAAVQFHMAVPKRFPGTPTARLGPPARGVATLAQLTAFFTSAPILCLVGGGQLGERERRRPHVRRRRA